jgi:hypothetical protein
MSEIVTELKTLAQKFKEQCKSVLGRIKEIIDKHPFLSIAAITVPIILACLFKLCRGKSRDSALLDAHHEGCVEGVRFQHRHRCLWCNKVYSHVHAFVNVQEAVKKGQLCPKCQRKGVTSEFEFNEPTGYRMELGVIKTFVPFALVEIEPNFDPAYAEEYNQELSASGDPKTRKEKNISVEFVQELSSSGDFHTRNKQVKTELSASGDPHTVRHKNIRTEGPEDLESQLRNDVQAHTVSQKALRNMYVLEFGDGLNFPYSVKCMFLKGRIAVTVAHALPYLRKHSHVRIRNQHVKEGHVISSNRIKDEQVRAKNGEFKDQVLLEFPISVHDHPDITKNIVRGSDMKFTRIPAVLMITDIHNVAMKYGTAVGVDKIVKYADAKEDTLYQIRQCYEYSLETSSGDCGGILFGLSTGLSKKILGLHVAGARGLGVSSPFNIEDIERALGSFALGAQISFDLDGILKDQTLSSVELPEGDFVPMGKAKLKAGAPSKTSIRPSLIHGQFAEVLTQPSCLRPFSRNGVEIDPMMKGLKKAGKIPPEMNDAYLKSAINDVERIVNTNIDPSHARVLTNMEAVAGVEGDPFLAGITRSTSAGYPRSSETQGMPGKTKWLGNDEYKLDPEIEQEMILIEERARKNERTPTIWTDTLKDERRTHEKVREGKTRVFSAGPMTFTLVFRKYFLGFAAHCAKNRIENEIAVGTNVYSYDWTRIALRLQSKGEKIIAGDFSNFDGTLPLEALGPIVEIVNKFYDDGEENFQIRRVLWKEIVNSVHIHGDNVYLWTHSQPSGCPITAILNSIFNSVSMRYVWMLVVPVALRSMKSFNKYVRMISYGDDNLVNISDEVIDRFNQVTIAVGYEQLGMVYTDEEKSGEMVPFRSLDNVSFLKRRFVWSADECCYLAPLSLDTVLETPNWIRGPYDDAEKTCENVENSCFELSLHGEKVFDEWTNKLKKVTRELNPRPKILTFDEYRTVELVKYGKMVALS